MTKEFIKTKIEILKKDLAMLTEGSVASDTLEIEIAFLERELKHIAENENALSQSH